MKTPRAQPAVSEACAPTEVHTKAKRKLEAQRIRLTRSCQRPPLFRAIPPEGCYIYTVRTLVAVVASLFLALFLAQTAAAQKTVSFPTEDGGLIYADIHGESARAVVLAHGGRFNKESWQNKLA